MTIPTRRNSQRITAEWFNTLRDAIAAITNTTKIVNGSYLLTGSDSVIQVTSITPATITLPSAFDAKDKRYSVKVREGGNNTPVLIGSVSIAAQSGEFIDGKANISFLENLQSIDVVSNGVEWVII